MTIARNDYARAFLFPSGIFANKAGQFISAMAIDSLSQDRGDVTSIQEPSEDNYGKFEEIDSIPGELSRMTTTLTSRMSRTELSTFYDLFNRACSFDLHLHFGLCSKPTDFNKYDKALVFENVSVTAFGTDPLVALSSGDVAVIQETLDISIGNFFEIVPLSYTVKASAQTTGDQVIDITISDSSSCGGDCEESSSGYDKIFAASSDFQAYASADGGINWEVYTVDATPAVGATVVGAFAIGDYYAVIASTGDVYSALKVDMLDGTAVFSQFTTSMTNPKGAGAYKNLGIIADDTGVIWGMDDSFSPTVLDNATATTEDLFGVSSRKEVSVVVGDNGAVVYSFDNGVWFTATAPSSAKLISVHAKSKTNWLVGADNGEAWATTNLGKTWSRVKYPNYAAITDAVNAIEGVNGHLIYMTVGAKLYRSIDGGVTWTTQPDSSLSFPTNTELFSVGVTHANPNYVLVGGINTNGLIVLGVPG